MTDINRYKGDVQGPDTDNIDIGGMGGERDLGEREGAPHKQGTSCISIRTVIPETDKARDHKSGPRLQPCLRDSDDRGKEL